MSQSSGHSESGVAFRLMSRLQMPTFTTPAPHNSRPAEICRACGRLVPSRARFCAECGAAIPLPSAPSPVQDQALKFQELADVIYRPLTVLFCDLVGSCQLTATLELEHFRDLVRSYQDIAAEVIGNHEGFVARYMGDGVLAYFGYPGAREDDAERAVRAGLALLQAISALEAGVRLQLRVSIATGSVIVDKAIGSGTAREIPVFGSAPNLASRMLSITPPGGVVVDEKTWLLLGGLFVFEYLGAFQLKGFAGPTSAWRAIRLREIQSRFAARRDSGGMTSCIGRDEEIAVLLAHAHHSAVNGLQTVIVAGDPGVGKSRLLHEASERMRSNGGTILSGDCTPGSQGAPFTVLMDAFRRAFGLSIMASKADVFARLDQALKTLGLESDENAALLLNLLGLARSSDSIHATDPLTLRRRTQTLLTHLLEAVCARGPAVLVLEDVHWIDPLSQEFLQDFVQAHAALPLLVILSSRVASASGWERSTRNTIMVLKPLSSSDIERLVAQRCSRHDVPRDIIQTIIQRSEGNPLFAEELLSLFLEQDAARAGREAGRVRWPQVPDTVAHATVSRLDRLDFMAQRLLGIAATIGVQFPLDLLAAVAGLPIHVVQATLRTDTEAIVHPMRSDGADYAFKHALVHEAVFGSLLASRRRLLHSQIAVELERCCADRPQAHADALAHHFAAAGNVTKAVEYLLISGDKRLAIYALQDADRFFKSAIEFVDKPDSPARARMANIVVRRMRILELAGAFGDIIQMAERYLPNIEAQGSSVELCLMLGTYAHALLHRHDYMKAEQVARRGLELSERLHEMMPAAYAKLVQMKILSAHDDGRQFHEVERLGREIIEMSEQGRDSYLACAARFQLALHHLQSGELVLAREAARELAEQGRLYEDTRAQSFAHWLLGWIHAQDRQLEAAMRHAEQSISTAVTEVDRKVGLGLKGAMLALTGRPAEGLDILLPARAEAAAQQDMNLVAALDPAIGVALILAGRIRQGIQWIDAATLRRDRDGYAAMAYYGRLLIGEIYVSMLSKPRTAATRTKARLSVRDFLFLAWVMPMAQRRAERSLKAAARNPRWRETSAAHVRIQICHGLIACHRNNAGAARDLLTRARATALAGGYTGLEQAAAAALATVPGARAG